MKKSYLAYSLIVNLIANFLLFNYLKILIYRALLNYEISNKAKIGFGALIICKKCRIYPEAVVSPFSFIIDCDKVVIKSNGKIYRLAFFKGLRELYIGSNSLIGVGCRICSRHKDRIINGIVDGGSFIMGKNVTITMRHSFDLSGSIIINENVVVGGMNTMFYTHGYDCYRNFTYGHIKLGKNIYIGAGSILLPGITITDDIVIGAGTIISKSIREQGVYVGSGIRKVSDDPHQYNRFIEK